MMIANHSTVVIYVYLKIEKFGNRFIFFTFGQKKPSNFEVSPFAPTLIHCEFEPLPFLFAHVLQIKIRVFHNKVGCKNLDCIFQKKVMKLFSC